MSSIPMPELCERFRQLYVPAVCDALDRHGLWHQILDNDIKPLTYDMVVAGPAFTVCGRPERSTDKSIRLGARAIDELRPMEVVVMQTGGDTHTGHWGELLTNGCLARGATGAVIDGGVRDTRFILELGFPVFCKFRCPGDARGRWNVTQMQTPITLGGVQVHPRDFIFGDADGVVVIPKDLTEEILVAAEKAVIEEREIRQRVQRGESVADLYLKYEQF